MEDGIRSSIIQLGFSILLIIIVLIVCKIKKLPVKETLALKWISGQNILLWLGLFIVLVFIEEYLSGLIGVESAKTWTYSPTVILLRAIGIIILAPIGEELLFRGLLFKRIYDTRLGLPGAILIPAILFSVIHIQYDISLMAFILIDGIFYGMARYYSGSTLLTILMHSLGNTYAVIERLY